VAYRILVTGSREWTDDRAVAVALGHAITRAPFEEEIVIVHGAAPGADSSARTWANLRGFTEEPHHYSEHASPKHRNDHMVRLGADICLAFAQSWASGTGHCARAARRAGIETIDYGVDTRIESRPW